jgi:hypothetical protein
MVAISLNRHSTMPGVRQPRLGFFQADGQDRDLEKGFAGPKLLASPSFAAKKE